MNVFTTSRNDSLISLISFSERSLVLVKGWVILFLQFYSDSFKFLMLAHLLFNLGAVFTCALVIVHTSKIKNYYLLYNEILAVHVLNLQKSTIKRDLKSELRLGTLNFFQWAEIKLVFIGFSGDSRFWVLADLESKKLKTKFELEIFHLVYLFCKKNSTNLSLT